MSGSVLDLVLVRHGVTDWNESGRLLGRTPIAINRRGRAQAEAAAAALRELAVGRLFVSPQRRAQETAEPIAEALGASVTTEPALDEVWLSERWLGKTVEEIREDPDFWHVLRDPTHACDAVEPASAVRDRVVAFVEGLRGHDEPEIVVLVSHGDPLRVMVSHYVGMPLEAFRTLTISNGSISALRFTPVGPSLRVLNYLPSAGGLKQALA
jgi:broad specificity phosphatase PhoE